jgi:hypothetical protein
VRRQEARGLVAVVDAQTLAGLVQMSVDGVLGNAELTADLFGAQVIVNQPQALALARRQQLDCLNGRRVGLAHAPKLTK